jgi:capsular exopolysaccharide synthesis family protein
VTSVREHTRDYPSILLARKWTVALVAGTVVAAGLFLSFRQTPVYRSSASVLVKVPGEQSAQNQINMATEKSVAQSTAVAQIVIANLDLTAQPKDVLQYLAVDVPVDTEILKFGYSDPRPATAQRKAEAFALAYLQYRRQALLGDLSASQRPLEERIRTLNQRLQTVQSEGDGSVQKAEASSLLTQIAILEQKLADLTPTDGLSGGEIIAPAILPTSPASPNHIQNAIIAVIVGLILGLCAALLIDYTDDRIRGREDLEAHLGVSVLGTIPQVVRRKRFAHGDLIAASQPESWEAEAFRRLGTNVMFAAGRRNSKTILITSSGAGEGKTVTVANLGVVLARAGNKVILVSADLRKPRLEQFFGDPAEVGLANILWETATLSDALLGTAVPSLDVLPSGSTLSNPTELLGVPRMSSLLREMRELADFVIVDSAPMLPVADSAVLAPVCDSVIFVADARSTRRSAIRESTRQLRSVNATLLGAVLTDRRFHSSREYYPYLQARGETPIAPASAAGRSN